MIKHEIEQFIKILKNESNDDNIKLAKMCMPDYKQKQDHILQVGKLLGRIEATAYVAITLEKILEKTK